MRFFVTTSSPPIEFNVLAYRVVCGCARRQTGYSAVSPKSAPRCTLYKKKNAAMELVANPSERGKKEMRKEKKRDRPLFSLAFLFFFPSFVRHRCRADREAHAGEREVVGKVHSFVGGGRLTDLPRQHSPIFHSLALYVHASKSVASVVGLATGKRVCVRCALCVAGTHVVLSIFWLLVSRCTELPCRLVLPTHKSGKLYLSRQSRAS